MGYLSITVASGAKFFLEKEVQINLNYTGKIKSNRKRFKVIFRGVYILKNPPPFPKFQISGLKKIISKG